MRQVTLLPALLLLFAGCAQLHREAGVPLEQVSNCPEVSIEHLVAHQDELGPQSETRTLECALDSLRRHDDFGLRRGPLASRVCLCLAARNPDSEKRQKLASEGVRFAEAAMGLGGGGDGAVHYYLAANLGLMVRDDITLAMANMTRLESEMKRAVELSPDIDYGGPLRLLGMLYLKAPPWPTGIGDGDKALELLKRVAEKHPAHPLNQLFYAQALWEVEGADAATQVESRMAAGRKLLQQGKWGYSREPWEREFAELEKEIQSDSATP